MSVFYIIRPLDEKMKEIFDEHGRYYPDAASRMPNNEEIKAVINRLGSAELNLEHLYIGSSTSLSRSDPVICSKKNEDSLSILRYSEDEGGCGPFMMFVGGYMDIVGPIVKELSRVCGPLVVLIDLPDDFDIITPETDIFEKFQGWM